VPHVRISLDSSEAEAAIRDLLKAAELTPEVVHHLLGTPQSLSQLFCVHLDGLAAPEAGHVRAVLQPTDFYRSVMFALRAGDGERLIVKDA
jgi:hypothetical protein